MEKGRQPVFGFEQGEGIVFDLHLPVGRPGDAENLLEVSHQPAHEVDHVHALVEELAAAAQGPVGAPFLVVAGPPAVAVPAAEIENPADRRLLNLFLRPVEGRMVPVVEARLERPPARPRRGDDPLGFPDVAAEGFFAQDVLAAFEGGDADRRQEVVGCRDDNEVDIRAVHDVPPIRFGRPAEIRQRAAGLRVDIAVRGRFGKPSGQR
jgi:hypothetical protein